MQPISTTDDIKRLGTILGVWAHPDDETFTSAGIMAAAVQNGQMVVCVTATRGELGIQNESRWPANQLGAIRTHELEQSYEILGIKHHYWLDYADGSCKDCDATEAVERIAKLIQKYQPDAILTFGPDGMTGHEDHKTASKWAGLAAKHSESKAKIYHMATTEKQYGAIIEADKKFNIYFNTDKPVTCKPDKCAILLRLDDGLYQKKLAALKAMESQTEGLMRVFGGSLRTTFGTEAFVEATHA